MEKTEKLRYDVNPKGFFARLTVTLLALSLLFRFIGYWGFWANKTALFNWTQILLPSASCLLYILCVSLLGKKAFSLSFIPVFLGAVFFVFRAFDFDSIIHTVLCIILYAAIAVFYYSVVLGRISKWVLLPIFGLPFIYHILVEDLNTLKFNEKAMSLSDWLPELSILCIMLALFFITFAMAKREPKSVPIEEGEPVTPVPELTVDPEELQRLADLDTLKTDNGAGDKQ